jgi:hypothetical protein
MFGFLLSALKSAYNVAADGNLSGSFYTFCSITCRFASQTSLQLHRLVAVATHNYATFDINRRLVEDTNPQPTTMTDFSTKHLQFLLLTFLMTDEQTNNLSFHAVDFYILS